MSSGILLFLLSTSALVPAEPGSRYQALDDPLLPFQWAIRNSGDQTCYAAGVDLDLLPAWEITMGDPRVIVAVLDSGADLDHPDLKGQFYPRGDEDWNFAVGPSKVPADGYGHGTAVCGIACAAAGNGAGIAGVAPGCRLVPLKMDGILDRDANAIAAIEYLTAFAGRHPELRFVMNGSITLTESDDLRDALARAKAAGIVLCFAAGNSGGPVETPARYPEVIAVGAIGPDGARMQKGHCGVAASGSCHGPELDVVAPGVLIATTDITGPPGLVSGDYGLEFGGTSAASPMVAGVVALMLSANPDLTPDGVLEILTSTAVDEQGDPAEDTPGFDEFMGWGRVDAGRAVAAAAASRARPGDVDCDGKVEIDDVTRYIGYLFLGQPMTACRSAYEVNGDGRLDIADPISIMVVLFGRAGV